MEEKVMKEYPQLRKEDIKASLLYASKCQNQKSEI